MNKILGVLSLLPIVLLGGGRASVLVGLADVENAQIISSEHEEKQSDEDVVVAKTVIVDMTAIEKLITVNTESDVAFHDVQRSNPEFDCLESHDHSRLCVCRGKGKITFRELIDATILGDLQMQVFPSDIDPEIHAVCTNVDYYEGAWYDYSKAYYVVPSRLLDIRERYRKLFLPYEPYLGSFKRTPVEKKNIKDVLRGVVAAKCRCEGCLHKCCVDALAVGMQNKETKRCLHCHDDITELLPMMRHNFVFDDGRPAKCLMCRADLWNAATKKKFKLGEVQLVETIDVP